MEILAPSKKEEKWKRSSEMHMRFPLQKQQQFSL